jgi:hypothetical protein
LTCNHVSVQGQTQEVPVSRETGDENAEKDASEFQAGEGDNRSLVSFGELTIDQEGPFTDREAKEIEIVATQDLARPEPCVFKEVPGVEAYDPGGLSMPHSDVSTTVEVAGRHTRVLRKNKNSGPTVKMVTGEFLQDSGALLIDVPADTNVPLNSIRDRTFKLFSGLKSKIYKNARRGQTGTWGCMQKEIDGKIRTIYFVVSRSSMSDKSSPDEVGYFVALKSVARDVAQKGIQELATIMPPIKARRSDVLWICEKYAAAFAGRQVRVRIYRPKGL